LQQSNPAAYGLGSQIVIREASKNIQGYYTGDTILPITVSNTTGLPEIVSNDMMVDIFPNPAEGNIHLRFNDYLWGKEYLIEIYSPDGKLILNKHVSVNIYNEILNLTFPENGIYLIKISTGKISQTQQIIIRIKG
jgi:Secretion system C-terminal sorting domain